jgi:hypothetical protein
LAQRQLATTVRASDLRLPDLDAPAAQGHLTRLVPMADSRAQGVVPSSLPPRPPLPPSAPRARLARHRRSKRAAILGRVDQHSQRLLHARRHAELIRADLLQRYRLHGASSCLERRLQPRHRRPPGFLPHPRLRSDRRPAASPSSSRRGLERSGRKLRRDRQPSRTRDRLSGQRRQANRSLSGVQRTLQIRLGLAPAESQGCLAWREWWRNPAVNGFAAEAPAKRSRDETGQDGQHFVEPAVEV